MFRILALIAVISLTAASNARAATPSVTVVAAPHHTESVRLRGGFTFNGGGGFGVAGGGSASFGARLGLQFNRWFSRLANVTLADFLDFGVGPSLDYSAIVGCSSGFNCDAAKGVEFGLHGRLALNLGGRDRDSGRRSAFTIGIDVHPIFTPAGRFFSRRLASAASGSEGCLFATAGWELAEVRPSCCCR